MAVPSLKRVMIKPEEFNLYHVQTTFGPSQSARWENLSSLEELWLPLEGREDEIGIIQPSLSKLKNLKCLYFAESREYDMAEAVTIHLGAQLPLLEVVSWDYCCCFRIFRDQEGIVESVSKQEYQKPKWQTFAPAP
ncbi:hypothetical protein BT96DRAFT_914337 [Gymnopus androsaceus JB14]|uniref:F-box domain-containing protein n=1 Tax=Gymnopus androsaceus JB14 TaxID=1447944 RepID=A0A6A4IFW6_9AGAR|nr:hypothetical protein BT96DRAFT_914337 [Gymnopus androsaceus JB14]